MIDIDDIRDRCGPMVLTTPAGRYLAAVLDELEALRAATRELMDEQNGPPFELPRHQKTWNAAMDKCRALVPGREKK